ncbi:hypothetical protein WKH56_20365 [Priestia sp. SB1]|uniref:hypothetical protein n=1 Tax=Priestia sp. SB1 TaxID=3132359 RepID=UPI003176129A
MFISIIVSAALAAIAVTTPSGIRLEMDKKKWRDEHDEWRRIVEKSHQEYWKGHEEAIETFKQEQKVLHERLINYNEREMYEYWSKEYDRSCHYNKVLFTKIMKEKGWTGEYLLRRSMEKFR